MLYPILLVTLCIILPFLIVDAWVNLQTWQNRIHIGRYHTQDKWQENVSRKALLWLKKSPTVPLTDQTRMRLWDMINGRYRVSCIQDWQDAGLLLGLQGHLATEDFIAHKIDVDTQKWNKTPQQVDSALLAYAIMRYSTASKTNLKPAMDQIYKLILDIKGQETTVPYRKNISRVRFVDTLGFICPFLYNYGVVYQVSDAITLAENQLKEYDDALLHDIFPAHAYHLDSKLPLGLHDWGRGIGWYILALTESYHIIQENKLYDRLNLRSRIVTLGRAILPHQKQSGGYADLIFDKQKSAESSATVLCGLLLNQCYKITREENFLKASQGCLRQLMKHTQRGGAIDICQGDTKGIGFYSNRYAYMPFVQGLALKLAREINN